MLDLYVVRIKFSNGQQIRMFRFSTSIYNAGNEAKKLFKDRTVLSVETWRRI